MEFLVDPVLNSIGCHASLDEIAHHQASGQKHCANLTTNGLLTPFTLALKVSLMSGVVLSSPVWLYQLWAFLAPGLHRGVALHGDDRRFVVDRHGVHRTDEADIVDALGRVRQQLGDPSGL